MKPKILGITDFESLPLDYCPGCLQLWNCKASNGMTYQVGKITAITGAVAYLYPASNRFARRTAEILRHEKR